MADAGVPVHVLRKITGHGSLTTTQRYLHPDSASIAAAGDSLTAFLRAPRSPTASLVEQDKIARRMQKTRRPGVSPDQQAFR